MENTSICRCCATEGSFKDIKNPYYWMGEEEVYADIIQECFDIKLSSTEQGGICEVCITQLRNASNFKKQVLNTEEQFKKHIQDLKFKATIVKEEVSAEEDDNDKFDSDDNLNQDDDDEDYVPEYEIPIKTETLEVKPKKRSSSAKATTSKSKKSKNKDEDSKTQKRQRSKKIVVVVTPPRPAVKIISKRNTELNKHQHNVNTILQCSNATPIRRYGGMGYACSYCQREVTAPRLLKDHTLQDHNASDKANFMNFRNLTNFIVKLDITDLHCTLCTTPFSTLDDLTHHLITIHNKTYNIDIKSHIIPFKFDTEFNCAICSTYFTNFKILLMHMNIHFRNFVCEICGQGFVNQKIFSSHMYRHDRGIFNCSFCNKGFDNRIKCKDHERAAHKLNNLRSKCGYCGEKFNDYTKKNVHVVKVHGVKPLVLHCLACSKTFDNQRALTSHTKKHHLLEKRLRK